jgi:drug/metabolite transporter (DMT)-like permease
MNPKSLEPVTLIMIIGGGVLYHLSQKATPAGLNPFLSLALSFGLASLGCLALFLGHQGAAAPALSGVNWTSVGLAAAVMLIESGYLIGYRAGLQLSRTAFACNNLVALALLGVGTFYYGENFGVRTGVGMVLCVAGLFFLRS